MFGGFNDHDAFGANWNLDEIQQLDDITAGGFLEEDPGITNDDASPQKEKLAISKQAMMPVKNSMIYNAWKQETSYIQFFNKSPDVVKIVGRLVASHSSNESTQFLIDDGTARIPCIYVHPSDMTSFRRRELAQVQNTTRMVVVYGSYNPMYSVKCPALLIFKIREVHSHDEFALHELDVVHLIMLNEREGHGMDVTDMNTILQNYDVKCADTARSDTSAASAQVLNTAMGTNGPLTLMKYVALLLANETRSGNLNGLHITEITQRCKQQRNFQSISEQHVRKVLAELEKDATVYQTLDANTFASTDA
ncbi:hypothetical protein X943_001817 [Babesia divergens]|uniref:Replication protein A C-terminal domain-containing protein n=1 Tax=Babesia divergens TaxID=32595 RepID=A0AAD9LJ30_BABDI|nr:hypothetical protein X943_001817 [Babesia divergens]